MDMMQVRRQMLMSTPHEATASGNPATFDTDGVWPLKLLKVGFEPVQDLHGYDNPWPAGGGKNLLQTTLTSQTLNGVTITVNDDGTISVSGTSTGAIEVTVGTLSGLVSGTSYTLTGCSNPTNGVRQMIKKGSTSSAAIAGLQYNDNQVTFTAEDATYYIRLYVGGNLTVTPQVIAPMIRLASITDATFTPYSNICPITGWTGLTLTKTRINLFDKNNALDGYIDDANGDLKGGAPYKSTDYIRVNGGSSYCVVSAQTSSMWGAWYDENKKYVSGATKYANSVITAPSNARYVRLTIRSGATGTINTFAVNYPSTDHDYHAYQGQTISVSWESSAGTVYGGTLDVVTGELTKTHEIIALSALNWLRRTTAPYRFSAVVGNRYINDISISQHICSLYPTIYVNALYNALAGYLSIYRASPYGNSNTIYMRFDDAVTTVSELTEFLAENDAKYCYPLATPITYHLTPQQVLSLVGENTVYSDTNGGCDVTYWVHGR